MKTLKKTTFTAFAAASALALAACGGEAPADDAADSMMAEEAAGPGTIVDVASGDEATFSTIC